MKDRTQRDDTFAPGFWLMVSFRIPESGSPKGGLFHPCCPTPSWTTWTRSWNVEVITSPGTPTTSSFWSKAGGRESG